MRNDRGSGLTGHPVRFLYKTIEQSPAFPPDVKRHVLMSIRPYTRVYRVSFEQAAASAVLLNAYAQWARWTAELNRCTSSTTKQRERERAASTRVEKWSHIISKCPASKGMISPQRHRVNLDRPSRAGVREIPPMQSTESDTVDQAEQVAS